MASPYDRQFFGSIDDTATSSARVVVPLLLRQLKPCSVLDIGGGIGSWLSVFAENGVKDLLCVDGDYVDQRSLRVRSEQFVAADLTKPLDVGRRFDLAVCLEVGEHLKDSAAEQLVESITLHSDSILFSAAVPFQGGTHHVNEQWPDYWSGKFRDRGFRCFDCVRWIIWNSAEVAWWYKQNLLVYLNQRAVESLGGSSPVAMTEVERPPAVLHPELYLSKAKTLKGLEGLDSPPRLSWAAKAFTRSAAASFKHHMARVFGAQFLGTV